MLVWLPSVQRLEEEGPRESPQGLCLDFFCPGFQNLLTMVHREQEATRPGSGSPGAGGGVRGKKKEPGGGFAWTLAAGLLGTWARGSGHFQNILLYSAALAWPGTGPRQHDRALSLGGFRPSLVQVCDGQSGARYAGPSLRAPGFASHRSALDAATGLLPETQAHQQPPGPIWACKYLVQPAFSFCPSSRLSRPLSSPSAGS